MQNKLNLLASTALAAGLLGSSGAVLAADFPVRAPIAPVAVAEPFSWTGCYVGINAGAAWTDIRQRVDVPASGGVSAIAIESRDTDTGFTGGAQAGCSRQFANNWVVGVEADINYIGSKHTWDSSFDASVFPPGGQNAFGTASVSGETTARWLATGRARLGYAFDRSLIYVTGGFAAGKLRSSVTGSVPLAFGPALAFAGSGSDTRFGWAAGAGFEHALSNAITLRLEYLHFDLGDVSYDVLGSSGGGGLPATWTANSKVSGDLLRLGMNLRF
jgi:outer membrane immunogenic protein